MKFIFVLTQKNSSINSQYCNFKKKKTDGGKNNQYFLVFMNMAEQQIDADKSRGKGEPHHS